MGTRGQTRRVRMLLHSARERMSRAIAALSGRLRGFVRLLATVATTCRRYLTARRFNFGVCAFVSIALEFLELVRNVGWWHIGYDQVNWLGLLAPAAFAGLCLAYK